MRLVLITDRRLMGETADAFAAAIAAAVRGLPARAVTVQVREKDLGAAALLPLVRAAIAAAPEQLVAVNDRLDVTLAARAAGVHLPEDGLDVAAARAALAASDGRLVGRPYDPAMPPLVIGCSRHAVDDVVAAAREGAGVVQLGPIYATPSKTGMGAPLGVAAIAAARAALDALSSPAPLLVAVGGIDGPARAAECRAAGADAVAAIRAVWTASDPAAAARALLG